MIQDTIDQFLRISKELLDQLEKEKAEIDTLKAGVLRREEEVNRRNEQIIDERAATLLKLNSIRDEKEQLGKEFLEARTLKAKMQTLQSELEIRKKDLDERETSIVKVEQSQVELVEREKNIIKREQDLEVEKQFLKKQMLMLDDKQQVLVNREKNVLIREERMRRLQA
jgi:hypothetical protein